MEVNAQGNPVVRDVVNRDVLLLEPLVECLQVSQAHHPPGHVVQAHLPLLGAKGVFPHFHQGHFVRFLPVGGQERGPARHEVIGMKTQDLLIPLL